MSVRLRIASYNIRKAVGLDWRRDAGRIVEVLGEIDADIVVLQEADKRLGNRPGVLSETALNDALGYRFADVDRGSPSHGWHGNAILYRTARFDLLDHQKVELPGLEPRGAVSATFGAPPFEVTGVHLGLTPNMRRRQMARLAEHIEAVDHPVLIAGDFNSNLSNRRIRDAFGAPVDVHAPGPSFHAARPMLPLDRFVLAGFQGDAQTHVHSSALASRASDHLPVVLEIDLPSA